MNNSGETDLNKLIKSLKPELRPGDFVFCSIPDLELIDMKDVIMSFQEDEGTTIILSKDKADNQNLSYNYVAAWITLKVHSSLQAVGLTAAFSKALAQQGISCNVVAAYYHDHIFVEKNDAAMALRVLQQLSAE